MARIIVNCQKVAFETTLGVAGFLLGLCSALASEYELVFVVNDVDAATRSPAGETIRSMASDIVPMGEAKSKHAAKWRDDAIELLPHHFQEPVFCNMSVIICFDLHIYDVPWKYKNVENFRANFCRNLTAADAVITPFPRTFYEVERTAGITLMNLFLTESPLLLDTRKNAVRTRSEPVPPAKESYLLYPAQLQAHKNHEMLIRAVKSLKEKGRAVQIVCPGSDFDTDFTAKLKSLVKESGINGEFKFIGRVSDEHLKQLYLDCHGVIVPSLAEGGAYVPMEAIAAGKPVAVNGIESAQLHVNSFSGEVLWFDAQSVESTAVAIDQLFDANIDDWLDRNALARRRINEMTWDSVAKQVDVLLRYIQGEIRRPIPRIDNFNRKIEWQC